VKRKSGKRINVPMFELQEIEDYYTYYVQILGIGEDTFWNADYSFLTGIVENYSAYKSWENYAVEKAREEL
jgi:hypothetical protein